MAKASASHDQERTLDIAQAATQGLDVSDVLPEMRCKYPSKFCGNARAPKVDGELHRFCEFHRRRANVNQKRWTSVRRRVARESREFQTRQDALKFMTATAPWMIGPTTHMGTNYYGPGIMSPTSGENFIAYDYMPNPFSTAALSTSTLLPFEDVAREPPTSPAAATLNDTEIDILTTLFAPTADLCAPNRAGSMYTVRLMPFSSIQRHWAL